MDLQSLAAATERNHRAFGFFKPLLAKTHRKPAQLRACARHSEARDRTHAHKRRRARGGTGSPRGPCRPPRPLARIEKRPPRARRPALPQPGAAVLSAKAGLTAGFGMGPGDPRLCGRARGGRSPAAHGYEPARAPLPGRPWRPCSEGSYSRVDASQNPLRGCEELGLSAALG